MPLLEFDREGMASPPSVTHPPIEQPEAMTAHPPRSQLPASAIVPGPTSTAVAEQQGAGPPMATPGVAPPNHTPTDPPLQNFKLHPENITAVSTAVELLRAVSDGARDIEIRAHLDLTPLLEDIRSNFHARAQPEDPTPEQQDHRLMQVDALAMLQVAGNTRSIRVSHFCTVAAAVDVVRPRKRVVEWMVARDQHGAITAHVDFMLEVL